MFALGAEVTSLYTFINIDVQLETNSKCFAWCLVGCVKHDLQSQVFESLPGTK